jgi:hypothetical protein
MLAPAGCSRANGCGVPPRDRTHAAHARAQDDQDERALPPQQAAYECAPEMKISQPSTAYMSAMG